MKQISGVIQNKIYETSRAFSAFVSHIDDANATLQTISRTSQLIPPLEAKAQRAIRSGNPNATLENDVTRYKGQLQSLQSKLQQQHLSLTVEARTFETAIGDIKQLMQQLITSGRKQPDNRGWFRRLIGV